MSSKYVQAHDMESWLRDSRIAARGFAHRWQSAVAAGNGEDAFVTLVDQYLRPDCDVLDLGCGHGEFTLSLAARCRTIVGIDREAGYLDLARELAAEQQITNAHFVEVNLAGIDEPGKPFAAIPLPDDSIDLFINRRGPILKRYFDEAMRVARPNAVIVGLHPTGNLPTPAWCEQLPPPYQAVFHTFPFDEVAGWVTAPLEAAGITAYSLWWIDVPEFLRNPYELFVRLGGDQISGGLPYQEIASVLAKIFEAHRTPYGIVLRHRRLLWQAELLG